MFSPNGNKICRYTSLRDSVTRVLGAPADLAQMMARESFEQIKALMDKVKIDKMEYNLDHGALLGKADSMDFKASADMFPTVFEILEKRKK